MSYEPGLSLNSHRIAGSYNWELKLNGFMSGNAISAKDTPYRVLIDTGTSGLLMPYTAW